MKRRTNLVIYFSVLIFLVSCENNSLKKTEDQEINHESKKQVINKKLTQKKLFLDFWSGMTPNEFLIIKNDLIENSILIGEKPKNDDSKPAIFEFNLGNKYPSIAYLSPSFINNSLQSISLYFKTVDRSNISDRLNMKFYPERQVTPFDKDGLLLLYKNKYGDYTYNSHAGEGSVLVTKVNSKRKIEFPSSGYESYLFTDYNNQKHIVIKLGIGEKYSNTKNLGQFTFSCTITYINIANYKKEKEEQRNQEYRKKLEEKEKIDKTKNRI